MKNTIKNIVYTTVWALSIALNTANAGITFEWTAAGAKVGDWLKWSGKTADVVIQSWVAYITNFLAIIAIIIILWAGFQILTSAGDEEKTKKWKTIIIQAIIWLIVIFLAGSIVNLVLKWLFAA